MKFSQLVIASAAIAAGVEGFSTSKLSVVRQVSSLCALDIVVIASWIKREKNGENWGGRLWMYTSHQLKKYTRYAQLCFVIHNEQSNDLI